jgi:LacI family transcriptional regulator
MPVSLKKIAALADVSIATVCLALQDDPRVAAATRRRLCALADQLGYVPSNLGRALQSGRSRLAGYLIHTVNQSYFNDILQGLGRAAAAANYGLLVTIPDGSAAQDKRELRLLKEKNIDGLIVSMFHPATLPALRELDRRGTPVVFCSDEFSPPDATLVSNDDFRGGGMAVEHLAERGCRRIAYAFNLKYIERRFAGCQEAAQRLGIPPLIHCASEAALATFLRAGDGKHPMGIAAYYDLDAIRALHVVRRLKLRVPHQVKLVGCDDSLLATLPEFDLSSVAPQKQEIGAMAFALLQQRLAGQTPAPCLLPPALIARGSSA